MTTRQLTDPLHLAGTTISEKYRIDALIGQGGFSLVYRATHLIWKQSVAVKVFRVLSGVDEHVRRELLDAFIREGKLLSELSSRSAAIVQARDIGHFTTSQGEWLPYMVLEWLEGTPLDALLEAEQLQQRPPRSMQAAMTLLESSVVAIATAHQKNVAHRDLKPANLFVVGDPYSAAPLVKVLDFGIAKVMAEHAHKLGTNAPTQQGVTVFTPNYGAPEQFSRTHGSTGPWTDVFALALILVELVRGGPALDGDDVLQFAIAARDEARRPTPRTFGVPVSDHVEAVFRKALAVEPSQRYPAVGEFWVDLHRAVYPESRTWTPGLTSSVSTPGLTSPVTGPHATGPYAGASHSGTPHSGTPHSGTPHSGTPHSGNPSYGPSSGHPASGGYPSSVQPHADTSPATEATMSATKAAGRGRSSLPLILGGVVGLAAAAVAGFILLRGGSDSSADAEVASSATPSTASASAAAVTEVAPGCPEGMVEIEGGKFFRGSDDETFKLWQPAHQVVLSPYCIDKTEVTAAAYKACSDTGECKRPQPVPDYPPGKNTTEEEHAKNVEAYAELCTFGKEGLEDHPINCVTWDMADIYCKNVRGGRLPTEAEWEFAARGSDGRKFPWGDGAGDETRMNACGEECNAWEKERGLSITHRMYDADDGFPGTAPVGSFPAGRTQFGLDDMVGNVWEWTQDYFAVYEDAVLTNPTGAKAGDRRAIRGGGFNGGTPLWLNPAFRYHQLETASAHGIGFRCVVPLPDQDAKTDE